MEEIKIKQFTKKHSHLLCIDSDGCVFDTMELKHKECFCPALIKDWHLQGIARYARETMEFVNLYSRFRGANPYLELVRTLKLLKERPEVSRRGVYIPDMTPVEAWIVQADVLTDEDLEKYIKTHEKNELLDKTLAYSLDGETRIKEMTQDIPPFPYVRDVLEKIHEIADVLVVSTAPIEQLAKEWEENDLLQYVDGIASQEDGGKAEIIGRALSMGYNKTKCIMLGDAPGDHLAAHMNGIFFYPIIPGSEEESWELFKESVSSLFYSGKYTFDMQEQYLKSFYTVLPERPSWPVRESKLVV